MTSGDTGRPRVAIVGGGLAGLAAALRLSEHGCHVQLFESRRQLGGRAASFREPSRDELVDYCQHVSMGCCTNFADFARRTGISDQFERITSLNVLASGKRYQLVATPFFPAPLHLLPALLQLGYLAWHDRLQTIRLLLQLARSTPPAHHVPPTGSDTMQNWLKARKVSAAALTGFWNVILVSALGESVDRVSVDAARKVLVDGFMINRHGYEVLVPKRSLTELIDLQVGQRLTQTGVQITRSSPVQGLHKASSGEFLVQTLHGECAFYAVVLATSWRHVWQLVSPEFSQSLAELSGASQIASAPITGVHLWFDRPITNLRHATIVGRLSQWLFARSAATGTSHSRDDQSHYYQVVISGSHDFANRIHDDVITEVLSDLATLFEGAQTAKLVQALVVTDPHAVFSYRPGLQRPEQRTRVPGLFLAGDWTSTGWPATMEGAVRSGYLAAENILNGLGRACSLLAPDLPRSWASRLLLSR